VSRSKLVWAALSPFLLFLLLPSMALATDLQWITLSAGTPPSARKGCSAVYDSQNQRMVVFGGENAGGLCGTTVYVLTLGCTPTWSTLTTSGTPPSARTEHSAIYDPTRHQMVVFGGEDVNGLCNDVHILDFGSTPPAWSTVTTSGTSPCVRSGHTAVYDGGGDRMVVFGGIVPFGTGTIETQGAFALSLSGHAWTPYTCHEGSDCVPINGIVCNTDARPSPREYHNAVFDGTRMIVYAGWYGDNNSVFGDARTWTSGTWASLSPSGTTPNSRENGYAVYDSGHDRMLVFGGDDGNGTFYNDLVALSSPGSSPQWLTPSTSGSAPSARSFGCAVYDAANDRTILFGGYDGSTYYDTAYALSADLTAPGTVSDLATSLDCGTGVVTVSWTAPGDDGSTGTACSYDLRWYNTTITNGNWASAWHLSAGVPHVAGTGESFQDSDLPACSHFYYALKTTDEAGNVSALGNNASLVTPCHGCGGPARAADVTRLALQSPAPNPTRTTVPIAFAIPSRQAGAGSELGIYDVSGRRVRLLRQGPAAPGRQSLDWNLRTDDGARIQPGLYFVRLRVADERLTKAVMITP